VVLTQEHLHTPGAIKERLNKGPKAHYLKEWVYGGIDGVVTTFAIIAGVIGANLSPAIVVILGVANLIGDGFSMAAGAYSSAKTSIDNYEHLRSIEELHIANNPEGEREEIRQIFSKKGFKGENLDHIIKTITENRQTWVDVMIKEEYGVGQEIKTPLKTGLHTFGAFALCGLMPLLPFILSLPHAFSIALFLSSLTFFAIGSFKSRWSTHHWWGQGLQTMFIGLAAAGLAFYIGYLLRGLGL
jgi:VIT1/CCC1 family predicted Fe2+/Mn2+ transporter